MTQIPHFTAQEIPPPKKTKASPKKAFGTTMSATQKSAIDKRLTSIYADENGQLPNMHQFDIKKSYTWLKRFAFGVIFCALLIATAWAGSSFFPGKTSLSSELQMSVQGKNTLTNGLPLLYTVQYKNTQNKKLLDATVAIAYPNGFVFASSSLPSTNLDHTELKLGDILPYHSDSFTISGTVWNSSTTGSSSLRANIHYGLENVLSTFQTHGEIALTTLPTSPFLTVKGPLQANVGSEVQYTFSLVKIPNAELTQKIVVTPTLPNQFSLTTSTPALNLNNSWVISPTSTANTLTLKGIFSEPVSTSTLKGAVDIYPTINDPRRIEEQTLSVNAVKMPLVFNLAINGATQNISTQPGGTLDMQISVKNSSEKPLSNSSIYLSLDAPSVQNKSILNWAQITDKLDGDITGKQINPTTRNGTLTWDKKQLATLANLKPGQEITLPISLPLKKADQINLEQLIGNTIVVNAGINFTDGNGIKSTLAGNTMSISLQSDLTLKNTVTNSDQTYNFHWTLNNHWHTLKNVVVSATAYGDVVWQGEPTPAGTSSYDSKNKTITWSIKQLPDSVDVLDWPFTLKLNTLNPTQNTLLSKITVQAEDSVSGGKINFTLDPTLLDRTSP